MERGDAEPDHERYGVDGRPAHHRNGRPPYPPGPEPGYGGPVTEERRGYRSPDAHRPMERPVPPRGRSTPQPGPLPFECCYGVVLISGHFATKPFYDPRILSGVGQELIS